MNDYLNHKWRNWVNEERRPQKRILREGIPRQSKKEIKTLDLEALIPQINESWGDPSNVSRQEVERLLSRVAQGGTLISKINKLNEFVNSCKGDDISRCATMASSTILSRLMALGIFSAIVYDFGASTQGFLFEVFMAAMLGADAQQVIASQQRKGGAGGDIADIVSTEQGPMSLKFFKRTEKGGGSDHIPGSVNDLLSSINQYGQPIPYLIAIKHTGGGGDVHEIAFYEFNIGANAHSTHPKAKSFLETNPIPEGMAGDVDIFAEGENWIKGTEFSLPITLLLGKTIKGHRGKGLDRPLAVLSFGSRDELQDIANNYVAQLGEDVTAIYNSLASLSTNINKYLLNSNNKTAGNQAVQDAKELARRTKKVVPTDRA